jgi:hypothetical protein
MAAREWWEQHEIPDKPRKYRSVQALARAFGMNTRTLQSHVADLPAPVRGLYDGRKMAEMLMRLTEAKAARLADATEDLPKDWKTRKERATALLNELTLAEKRGDLIDIEEARRQVAQGIQEAKVALMGVPGRVADLMPPGVAPQVRRAVQTEIRAVLAGLTAGRFANFDQKKETEDDE